MITMKFKVPSACTLNPEEVFGPNHKSEVGYSVFTHADGWTIGGVICEDYYMWVNYFEASHPDYGLVRGNFEDEVQAESLEAFEHFTRHHAPYEWDYGDI